MRDSASGDVLVSMAKVNAGPTQLLGEIRSRGRRRVTTLASGVALLTATSLGTGCMALSPQLPPTDFAVVEQVEDRQAREEIYAEQQIYVHNEPQGQRYTKGADVNAQKRSWQSLDAVLRSDAHSAAALPVRQQRLSRLFTALTVVAGIVTVAGAAASAREGLNLGDINATGGLLLGGGLATIGFGITAGVFYGKTRRGYEDAVDVYNDSLGMRMGILDGRGEFVPARGMVVDENGYVVLDPTVDEEPAAEPKPADIVGPQPEPAEPEVASPEVAEPEVAAPDAPDPVEPTPVADPPPAETAAPDEAATPPAEAASPSEPVEPVVAEPPAASVARLRLLRD